MRGGGAGGGAAGAGARDAGPTLRIDEAGACLGTGMFAVGARRRARRYGPADAHDGRAERVEDPDGVVDGVGEGDAVMAHRPAERGRESVGRDRVGGARPRFQPCRTDAAREPARHERNPVQRDVPRGPGVTAREDHGFTIHPERTGGREEDGVLEECDAGGAGKLACLAHGEQEVAVGCEELVQIAEEIPDDEAPRPVDGEPAGRAELAGTVAFPADVAQEASLAVHEDDGVGSDIGDVQVARRVERERRDPGEGSPVGRVGAADPEQLLDARVDVAIGRGQVADSLRRDGHGRRAAERGESECNTRPSSHRASRSL